MTHLEPLSVLDEIPSHTSLEELKTNKNLMHFSGGH